jgi:hypothetical protein
MLLPIDLGPFHDHGVVMRVELEADMLVRRQGVNSGTAGAIF